MNWEHFVFLFFIIATNFGTFLTISLYLNVDRKLEFYKTENNLQIKDIYTEIKSIKQELRDNYVKLCVIEEKVRR